jgi:ribonuclease HI
MTQRKIRSVSLDSQLPEWRCPTEVEVATDAAIQNQAVGSGYIATSGHYGLAGHPQPGHIIGDDPILVGELRAIWRAVSRTRSMTGISRITVLTDCQDAVSYLQRWRQGRFEYPRGYSIFRISGNKPSLQELAEYVRREQDLVRFRWLRGHTGHPLNETADSLAKLGLRTVRHAYDKSEVRRLAPLWAQRTLKDYRRTGAPVPATQQ